MLISHTAALSTNDLIAAANLMEVPQKKSMLTMILDAVFGDIESILSAIPGFGSAVAAVVQITYSTARILISNAGQNPGVPIEVAIANVEDKLNVYLGKMIEGNANNYAYLTANYGRMKALTETVTTVDSMISPSAFGFDGSKNPGQDYLTGIANAWSVVILKSLMASNAKYQHSTDLSLTTTLPARSFRPADSKYGQYNNFLPALYRSGTNDDAQEGYMVANRKANVPAPVTEKLLSSSNVGLHPYWFYNGVNGWPQPKLGSVADSYNEEENPIVTIHV